ncbi:lasso peptide isopeptide bond-forming cyclase [Halobacillus campisalis]|uniref:asparagine synthase (glutamine-hydrolyzing) n=1 Tax=Halobacillus campisalis TaxID=435909 RepID=A0ABW2K9D3_9BACI|nr:lasso peptide isopeptide bond-forming cyclase [Halobacillus campisalis]
MGAIVGIYNFNKEPSSQVHRNGMMNALQKFPADDVQTWDQDNIFLGCHAQWITPESVGEKLPYYDPERNLAITADAIIDNRQELFDALGVSKTLRLKMPDSKLILLAYHKWGEESPKHLIGDFAFMIWDEREQKLFGARDFSGSRTLYYFKDTHRFIFSTIIHPFFTLPYIEKKLDEQWLAEYLTISGMIDSVDAVLTPYKTIQQIPPSHSITIRQGEIYFHKYCSLKPGKQIKYKSNQDYVEAFQEVFQKAVDSRLRTHRNIGAQLSGGLDSGAVVGFASNTLQRENKLLHTFSYIPPKDFEDFTPKQLIADESPNINLTVKHVGGIIPHYLDFEGKDSYSEMDEFLEAMEMPYKFVENSFWLKGMFEKAHQENIGVLLNGDRGNFTISWGSALDYYATLLKKMKWLRLTHELHNYSQKVGGARFGRLPSIAKIAFPTISKLLSSEPSIRFPMLVNPEFEKKNGVLQKLTGHGIDDTGWLKASTIYEERRSLFEDMFPWSTGNTLTAKLSLRYSLWKRDPTNDLRVVQFCLALPEEQFIQSGVDRSLVRRSTEKLLPDEIRLNQKTRGVQGVDWVHRMIPHWECFAEEVQELSKDPEMQKYINMDVIKKASLKLKEKPNPAFATNADYRLLMRSLIVYRHIKSFH